MYRDQLAFSLICLAPIFARCGTDGVGPPTGQETDETLEWKEDCKM